MNKQPQKRKPLHGTTSLNEIVENVKNSAKATQARSRTMHNNETNGDETTDFTSDDDLENEDDSQNTRSVMNTTYDIVPRINVTTKTTTNQRRSARTSQRLSDQNNKRNPDKEEISKNNVAHKLKQERLKTISHQQSNSSSNFNILIILLLLVILGTGLFFYINMDTGTTYFGITANKIELIGTDREKSIQQNVIAKLKSFKKIYKNQEMDLWEDAFVSITDIMREPKKPSIMLLLGNNSDPLACLASVFGNISSNLLDSHTLLLKPENFEADMGSVITSLRSRIKDNNNKVIIIWDLLNINVEALKAFHNLCDRINPLVDEVIYIITIIADDYDKASNQLEFIEKKLFNKLSGKIKEDAIQPLITRMTDGPILTVKPEPTISECPLTKASRI